MRRFKMIIGLSLLVLSICFAVNSSSAQQLFAVGTAGAGGTFNYVGSSLSVLVSNKLDNIELRALETGGSNANIRLVADGEVDLALGMGLALNGAYTGLSPWEGNEQKNIRAITRTHASTVHYVIRKGLGIESFADFVNFRGNTDVAGSGAHLYHENIFEFVDGVDWQDIEAENVDYHQAVQLFQDGHIDWFLCGGTVPEPNVTEVASARPVDLLDIDGELRENILEKYPFYYGRTLPAGTYPGIDRDVETIEAIAVLWTDESMSEEVVYEITKAIFENIDEVNDLHIGLSSLSLDNATGGLGVPLHPGAERYYKEVGVK